MIQAKAPLCCIQERSDVLDGGRSWFNTEREGIVT
jgi:hypothetical protein